MIGELFFSLDNSYNPVTMKNDKNDHLFSVNFKCNSLVYILISTSRLRVNLLFFQLSKQRHREIIFAFNLEGVIFGVSPVA